MKKFLLACIFLCWLNFALGSTVTDDIGNRLELVKPAQRIIALAPDITEILFAIGAADKITGVISGCDFPEQAKKIPVVGAYNGLNLEVIVRLRPDLIIVWKNSFQRQVHLLKKLGVPIYVTDPKNLEDVARSMQNLGELTGLQEKAHAQAQAYLQNLEKIAKQYRDKKKLKIYYQIGRYSLLTVNDSSWISQAIRLCAGENVFGKLRSAVPEITWEAFIHTNPQVIISDAPLSALNNRFKQWENVLAVKHHQLYSLQADLIDRAGPRVIEGVQQMCSAIDHARRFYN